MQRLSGLDLLRAVAIVWVMIFHALGAGIDVPIREISRYGWMGVDLFFVLSGFLIGSQLLNILSNNNNISFRAFYINRAFRILPAYLFVLFLYFEFPSVREREGLQPLWQFLTFTVNVFIDTSNNRAFSHVWSLCVEEYFYLLLPVCFWSLRGRSTTAIAIVLALLIVVGGMLLRGYIWTTELEAIQHIRFGEGNFGQRYIENIYYPMYTRLDGLLAGVILALLKTYKPVLWSSALRYSNTVLSIGLVGLGLAVSIFNVRFGFIATVVGFPLLSFSMAFIVAASTSSNCILGKYRVPGAWTIATLAYSLYLTHKAVFHIVKTDFWGMLTVNYQSEFLVCILSALCVGGALFIAIERPFLLLRQRIISPATAQ